MIEEALDRLPPHPTPLRAALVTRRAQYLGDEARLTELESTSQAAADVARSCGSATTLAMPSSLAFPSSALPCGRANAWRWQARSENGSLPEEAAPLASLPSTTASSG